MAEVVTSRPRTRSRLALANITNNIGVVVDRRKKNSKSIKRYYVVPRYEHSDIYQNMRQNESRYYPCVDYTSPAKQLYITHKMRTILVSWLVEVADEYTLCSQTLHLAVYLLDAYLNHQLDVPKNRLQLVGVTCMLIAAKYEEVYPPTPKDCSYITDHTYSSDDVLAMEQRVLLAISFQISAVTSLEFKRRFLCEHPLVNYLLELALQEPIALKYRPSQLAVSTCAYVRLLLGQPVWPDTMPTRSGYSFDEVRPIIVRIHDLHRKHFGVTSIRYSDLVHIPPLKAIPTTI